MPCRHIHLGFGFCEKNVLTFALHLREALVEQIDQQCFRLDGYLWEKSLLLTIS